MFFVKTRKAQIVIVATALISFFPGSYLAQGATTTTLEFVINPFTGALSINVPLAGSFGTLESPDTDTAVTGQLESVTVTDTRRVDGVRNWSASAIASDLITGSDSLTASSIGYSAGIPTIISGLAGVTEWTRYSLKITTIVQTGSSATGKHVVSWRPILSIGVPAEQDAGTYVGTLTHSVV